MLKPTIPIEKQIIYPNTTYLVNTTIDCRGKEIEIPANCILSIKSGTIRNGTLVGNKTKLKKCAKKGLAIIVNGSWRVQVINDCYFDSSALSDDQIIGNINVLQSDEIQNNIIIGTKDYQCNITKLNGSALILRSKTKCILGSTISLLACDFPNYQIVQIYDVHDVEFTGGSIVGDMLNHSYTQGSTHEWGHGISIKNAQRIKVSSVNVSKCIGDGVVVGGWLEPNTNVYEKAAKNVRLENLVLDDNRRQALTISHADGVVVKNCKFTNTGKTKYTAPASGVDIEPNAEAPWNQGVKNVNIEKCYFSGNKYRQFLSHGYLNRDDEDNIQNVVVKKCVIEGICDVHTGGITFQSCTLESVTLRGGKDKIENVRFERCSFTGKSPLVFQGAIARNERGTLVGGKFGTINLLNCTFLLLESSEAMFNSPESAIGSIDKVIINKCNFKRPANVNTNRDLASGKFEGKMVVCKTNTTGINF